MINKLSDNLFTDLEINRLSYLNRIFEVIPRTSFELLDSSFSITFDFLSVNDKCCFSISKTYEPVSMSTRFVVSKCDWFYEELSIFNSFPNIEAAMSTLESEARLFCNSI